MATHGRCGLRRALMGSVADRVLRTSRVPLLLLHAGGHQVRGLETIVVPVDGSPGAAFALSAAAPLARATGASLALVRASVPLPSPVITDWHCSSPATGALVLARANEYGSPPRRPHPPPCRADSPRIDATAA